MRRKLALWPLVLAACQTGAVHFPVTDPAETPTQPRPAGILFEPPVRLPDPVSIDSAESGLLVLRSPAPRSQILDTVRRFFRALVDEVPADLDDLLANSAWLEASSERLPARNAFRARFAEHDYPELSGIPLYREHELQIYRAGEAKALSWVRDLPTDLPTNDLVVRVRMIVSHPAKRRLLPEEVVLFLRSGPQGLQIYRIAESTAVQ